MGQIKNEWLAKRRRDINFSVHSFPVLIILPHSVYRNFESLSMFVAHSYGVVLKLHCQDEVSR